ncbi:MAG: hypothetical protein NUW37_04470 [Planctomycetes bacterium]|nr:hypothetical protein [Planctomycetota bacterium]
MSELAAILLNVNHFILGVVLLFALGLSFACVWQLGSKHANLKEEWTPPPGYTQEQMNAADSETASKAENASVPPENQPGSL